MLWLKIAKWTLSTILGALISSIIAAVILNFSVKEPFLYYRVWHSESYEYGNNYITLGRIDFGNSGNASSTGFDARIYFNSDVECTEPGFTSSEGIDQTKIVDSLRENAYTLISEDLLFKEGDKVSVHYILVSSFKLDTVKPSIFFESGDNRGELIKPGEDIIEWPLKWNLWEVILLVIIIIVLSVPPIIILYKNASSPSQINRNNNG